MNKPSPKPDPLSIFIDKCRQNNLKITPQRTTIYRSLIGVKDHPSADMVYKKIKKEFPNISFDTVNRTLITFAEIGIIHILEGQGDPRRFDPNLRPHHHFHCQKCKEVFDFSCDMADAIELPDEITSHCIILSKRMVLSGYCKACHP